MEPITRVKINHSRDLWAALYKQCETKNKIGILCPCSYPELIDISQAYVTGKFILDSYPSFLKTIIANIKSHNLEDRIHLLPVFTHFHEINDKEDIPTKLLNNCLKNIIDHIAGNWAIIKIQKLDEDQQISDLVDFKYFQSNISSGYFTKGDDFVVYSNIDEKDIGCMELKTSAMGYMTEYFNIICDRFTDPRAKKSFDFNFPQAIEQVPTTLGSLVERKCAENGLQIGKILFCKFSPSYNLRICCQGAEEAAAVASCLAHYGACCLDKASKIHKLKVMMKDQDKFVSIHASNVIEFLKDMGMEKTAIEHLFRFGFLVHKYVIKSKKAPKVFPTDRYFDFRFSQQYPDFIDCGAKGFLVPEFLEQEVYRTEFKQSITAKLEKNVVIEEKNISYFLDFMTADAQ